MGSVVDQAVTGVVAAAAAVTVGVVVRDARRRRLHPPRVLSWDEVLTQLEITPEPWQRWWLNAFLSAPAATRASVTLARTRRRS